MATPPFIQNFVDGPPLPKVVLGVLGLGGLVAGAYFLLLAPVQARVDGLVKQNETLQRELTQARAQVADLARFRRELAEIETKLAVLRDKLPTERETPALYRALNAAAGESGLGVALFQPRPPQPKDYVNEIPITITAEGGYHQLAEFLERVSRLPRVVTVATFKVAGQPKARHTIKADLTLATFTYLTSPPAPKPGAGTPARQPAPARPGGARS
jgi:type IV pilus assembly protein PilO